MTKPTKWHVHPVKTQISLDMRPVWSESSLSAWNKLGSLTTHWALSKDSDQTGRMPRLIWVFAGHTCHFVGFVMRQLKWCDFWLLPEWRICLFYEANTQNRRKCIVSCKWCGVLKKMISYLDTDQSRLSESLNRADLYGCSPDRNRLSSTSRYMSRLMTKLTKWHVCPPNTQISLGIRPVWSESSLCAHWVAKDISFLHADSEDWWDWADAQADLSLRWSHMLFCWFCHEAAQLWFCRK